MTEAAKGQSATRKGGRATGAVLVIGGGIAGIQASLDLAESGQKVYLVEKSPAIGGNMAKLDKTFPTNDCSLCILSPKLVECGRHRNVELMTMTDVIGLTGEPGRFTARILRKARYVDLEKCTGCGICMEKCPKRFVPHAHFRDEQVPVKSLSEFEAKLRIRRAIARPFPQALPNAPAIDAANCIRLTRGGCGLCQKNCQAGAINFEDKDQIQEIEVGAVVVVPGFEEFAPYPRYETGYSRFSDVVTAVEFEKILSASGPFGGHVMCPSDGRVPRRIAFLQCVGSRDLSCRNGYCSSVCCMYAIKEAVIAKEHIRGLDVAVHFMDMRAFGKDFDKYYERAQKEHGIRFERGRVFAVEKGGVDGGLTVKYAPAGGGVAQASYDMIVLSVGLEPTDSFRALGRNLGVKLNSTGFIWTDPENPMATSRAGVFAGGVASGPKDIPETVVQASAAASEASALLAKVRNTLTVEREYPTERDMTGQAPRIGVFVCHCGINIGGIVNVPGVRDYARGLANVVYTEDTMYACSQDTQNHIRDVIKAENLNRVVVASCSPRTHEPLFQQTLREAGLNPHLFEMANIRDQCSWIHMDQPEEATEKSKALVRMAVAKVALVEALQAASLEVTPSALVIGGGLAGMTAALTIADQGFKVGLVEREKALGGNLRRLRRSFDEPDIPGYLARLAKRVESHKGIRVFKGSEFTKIDGFIGNFESTITGNGRESKVKHGVIIVATGGGEAAPSEYLYGQDKRILTQLELEKALARPKALAGVKSVVMIQCVGSREEGHQYCSRVCCNTAIKNALQIKSLSPETAVYVLYRDIRSYGFSEMYFQAARDRGVIFVRYDLDRKPEVRNGNGMTVTVREPLLGQDLVLSPDLLVLSSRIDPDRGNEKLAQLLKVPMNEDRFFLEAHVKLRPVEFATEGIFVAGLAHSPKSLPETLAQAKAAASKAVAIISKPDYEAQPTIAAVNEDLCDGCGICVPVCDYNALRVIPRKGGKENEKVLEVNEAMCKGCGACVAACPSGAMEQKGFKNEQMLAMIRAALEE